jgi:Tol biopolymer transport system component
VLVLAAAGCGFTAKTGGAARGSSATGGASPSGVPASSSGGAGGRGASSAPSATGSPADAGTPPLVDFPAAPVVDPSAPANAPELFDGSAPRGDGAPCITAPLAGTLMPRNWLRPRFELAAAAGENLFEIDLSVAGFAHPLRVFTATPSYAMDYGLWNSLRTSINDRTITVTMRALTVDASGAVTLGPSAPASSSFVVAPVDAPGKIVYWALADDMGTKVGSLKGFGIGEESVENVLVPSQVQTRASNDTCIGCHSATPDGNSVGFTMGPQNYFNQVANVTAGTIGTTPSYATASALATMQTLHGIPAYSRAHWSDNDRVALLSDTGTLHWVEVNGAASGTLARTGDGSKATEPAWSHDGNDVVYVSAKAITDGRLDTGPADLYRVPYQNGAGGTAAALPGASDAGFTEYYPAFSPDDALLAFTRVPGADSAYSNPAAEVYLLRFNAGAGGTPIRLGANDAAACQTSLASPGLTNDWPKWSPQATTAGGKTYYWLTFSSKRTGTNNAQLYITAVVVDGAGQITTFPALYLWNQPSTDGNHTPSWDDFAIPSISIG